MANRLPHYCVVGGGISGLATAYFISLLKPAGSYRLTVLEASPRCGGWIHSVRNPNTGAVYDLGPHSARATSPSSSLLLRLALSLDLRDSLLWLRNEDDCARSYIYVGGQLVPISPLGFRATQPFTRSPLGMITRRILSRSPPAKPDWSVDEFLRTRLDDEFADYLGSAMMRGIYAGDSRELSARACLPKLVKAEELGPNMILGLLRGARKEVLNPSVDVPSVLDTQLPQSTSVMPPRAFAWSLSSGMQTLTNALYYRLRDLGPHTTVHVNSPVRGVHRGSDGRLHVDWCPDQTNQATINNIDAVFLCCPSYQAANVLQHALSPTVVTRLTKPHMPWTDVAAVVLELTTPAQPPVRGFGHLVPRMEDEHVLGVIYDSVAFPQLDSPQGGSVRYTVMMKPLPEWLQAAEHTVGRRSIDRAIEAKAVDVLRDHLKLPTVEVIDRQVGIYRDCIPQYPLGHLDNVRSLREEMQASGAGHVHLVGYSYDGVGIGDAVHSALRAVCSELEVPC